MSVTAAPARQSRPPQSRQMMGLRIHTHGEITASWLRDTILPVWSSARSGGRRLVLLRRGWVGGPHVSVIAVGPGADTIDWSHLAAAVDPGPAPAQVLDPATYLDRARTRGQLEGVEPPYLPLRAHGTTLLIDSAAGPAKPMDELSGITDAILAAPVVRHIGRVADQTMTRGSVIVDVLTAVAQTHALGPGYGTFSLRSHAEALLANWSSRGELRREFARRYEAQRDPIVARVRALIDGSIDADVTAWRTALSYVQGVVDETVRRNELTTAMVDAAAYVPTGDGAAGRAGHPNTDFHRRVYGSGVTESAGEWFAGYRFVVNRVYAQLPLLGISPLERAYGCWGVAEAIDEVLGTSWADRLTTDHQREVS